MAVSAGVPSLASRPARWTPPPASLLGLVVLGGAVGTGVRYGLSTAFPAGYGEWPWAIWAINMGGAFLLGFLLEALAATGPDAGWRRAARLGLGTGVLGGFTTYSTFTVETVELWQSGHVPQAVSYVGLSLIIGAGAALLGLWSGRGLAEATR